MYVFDFKQRAIRPGFGHFFVLRSENVASLDNYCSVESAVADLKPTGYQFVFGGEYGDMLDVSDLGRTLRRMDGENGTYHFREGDVLVIVANHLAFSYVMYDCGIYFIDKNSFADACAKNFASTSYICWGNRNIAFTVLKYKDGYAIDLYDEKDRHLLHECYESIFQNWFVLLNEALFELKEPVFDTEYHYFCSKTVSSSDLTALVPERPTAFFYATDSSFVKRSIRAMEEEAKKCLIADAHRRAMYERYKDMTIQPDIVEDIALVHIKEILEQCADEPITIKDVVFYSYKENDANSAPLVAVVAVLYDSVMTEEYFHDLLCVRCCSYTKGGETVYVEFVPIRKEQTGTFEDYLSVAKTGVSKKTLFDSGIETLYNGQKAYILIPTGEDVKDEMHLPVYDEEGKVLDRAVVYTCEGDDFPYLGAPLLFAELGGKKALTMEQRFNLIELFEGWYSEQAPFGWADEFPMAVSMLASQKTKGAVLLNPRHLPYNDEFFDVLLDILWPEEQPSATKDEIPFWIGAVEHETGKVLEVHTDDLAKLHDYHTAFYFSEDIEKRQEQCEVSYFWITEGAVKIEPDTAYHNEALTEFLCRRIDEQIQIVTENSAILKGGATA